MNDNQSDFEDPALRKAVRKALAGETAPARLRQRVHLALAAEQANIDDTASAEPSTRRAAWRSSLTPGTLALAAVVLVAVGFAVMQVMAFLESPQGSPIATAAAPLAFPVTFGNALISTHDHCAKLPSHYLVPGNEPEALRDRLAQEEGIAVSAIDPGDGWQFKGAGLCKVEHGRAAHLLFVRGDDTLSIFSLPAPESCHESAYSQVVAAHPMVGFTRQGALYCVVGSATDEELTLAEIEPIVHKVKASVGLVACDVDDSSLQTAYVPPPRPVQHALAR